MKKAGKKLTFSALAAGAAAGLTGCGLVGMFLTGETPDQNMIEAVYGPPPDYYESVGSPMGVTEVPEETEDAARIADEALTEALTEAVTETVTETDAEDPEAFDPDENMLEDVYGPPGDFGL